MPLLLTSAICKKKVENSHQEFMKKEINQLFGYILISKQLLTTFPSYLIFNSLENDEKKY